MVERLRDAVFVTGAERTSDKNGLIRNISAFIVRVFWTAEAIGMNQHTRHEPMYVKIAGTGLRKSPLKNDVLIKINGEYAIDAYWKGAKRNAEYFSVAI